MRIYHFEGTLDGLLCVVFAAYRDRAFPVQLLAATPQAPALFAETVAVPTNPAEARRVAAALVRKNGPDVPATLERVLNAMPDAALTLFHFIVAALGGQVPTPPDVLVQAVMDVETLDRRIGREIHRMHAFARFEQTADGLYVATVAPEYDVLPYTIAHFVARFPAQRWLLVDDRRGYGLYYDGRDVQRVAAESGEARRTEEETVYQDMWRAYFRAVNIPERQNLRLHRLHLPRRYWRYLTEKKPFTTHD